MNDLIERFRIASPVFKSSALVEFCRPLWFPDSIFDVVGNSFEEDYFVLLDKLDRHDPALAFKFQHWLEKVCILDGPDRADEQLWALTCSAARYEQGQAFNEQLAVVGNLYETRKSRFDVALNEGMQSGCFGMDDRDSAVCALPASLVCRDIIGLTVATNCFIESWQKERGLDSIADRVRLKEWVQQHCGQIAKSRDYSTPGFWHTRYVHFSEMLR